MSGVQENMGGTCALPDKGEYNVEIALVKEGNSKSGDPMPSIKLRIVSGIFVDSWVWDNILLPHLESGAAKILGRTKHFLHCIGESYEGEEVQWDTDNWINKRCRIRIDHELPNQYHKYTKLIVAEYIVDDEAPVEKEDDPFNS